MGDTFPKVLIVSSDSLESATGTGVTLRNLFRDWPPDRIAQLHLTGQAQAAPPANRMRIPDSVAPIDFALRAAIRQRRPGFADGAPAIAAVPLAQGASKAARRHADIRALLDLSPLRVPDEVTGFVSAFDPDVVYSLLGSDRVIRIARDVARKAGAPLVPHFMDDWPSTLYSSGELAGFARHAAMKHLGAAVAEAPFALCISPLMAEEYSTRFQVACEWFVNPVDSGPFVSPTPRTLHDIAYVGGLHLGRWEVIQQVARSLARSGAGGVLTVHAPQRDLDAVVVPEELSAVLRLGGQLEPGHVAARLTRADVLLHVESFDEATRRYTRLSLSTKVPQYLAAGRPVLAVGPVEQASMQVVRESGGGVVTDLNETSLDNALDSMLEADERRRLGAAGQAFAAKNFTGDQVRARLRSVLSRAGDVTGPAVNR